MKRIIMIMSFIFAVLLTVTVYGIQSYDKYEIKEDSAAEYGECKEHVYPNGGDYTVIDSSCSRKGMKYRTCAVCAYTDRIEIPKNPDAHSLISPELTYETKPTCTHGGVGFYLCLSCNEIAKTVELDIDPEAHLKDGDFVVIEKETCMKDGKMAHKCQYCNEYFNEQTIPSDPQAHVMTDSSKWVVTVLPTCAQDGIVEGYCDECSAVAVTKSVAATGNHVPADEWLIVSEPTCSSDGIKAHKCTVCEQAVDETPIPSDPEKHEYSDEFTVDVAATCSSDGSQSRHCLHCNAKIDESVISADPSAHAYNEDWVVTSEPTCAEPGSMYRVCKICGEKSPSSLIPKVEHTYPEEYEVIKESADGASVQVKYKCTVCSEEFITIITLGNNPGDGNIGDNIDPETKKYILTLKDNTVVRVDYDKMLISNVARNMTVGDLFDKFTNSNVFVVYDSSNALMNEEDLIGTGHRFNYATPDGNVTNYYVSVTGDLNSDGKVTAADARKVLRLAAKVDVVAEPYSTAADVNLDGDITSADARLTLRVASNMEYFKETYVY